MTNMTDIERLRLIVVPAGLRLAELRAAEIIASSQGDLETAEANFTVHREVVGKLKNLLAEWTAAKSFPIARIELEKLLTSYV